MTTLIRLAGTTAEIDELFRFRHNVFVTQENYIAPRRDERIYDRFDAYPSTGNLIAVDNGRIVGAVRVTKVTSAGAPTDDFYDFSEVIASRSAAIASAGMLCMDRASRRIPHLRFAMTAMAIHWAYSRGLARILITANPKGRLFFQRMGFKALSPELYSLERGLPFVAMSLDISDAPPRYQQFLRGQEGDLYRLPSPPRPLAPRDVRVATTGRRT